MFSQASFAAVEFKLSMQVHSTDTPPCSCRIFLHVFQCINCKILDIIQSLVLSVVDIGETRKLWRRVEPFIRKVLNGTSLHDTSTSQPGPGTIPDLPGRVPDLPTRVPDLPLSSKYLLLASFLASNNPASTDKQFFSNVRYYL